MQLLFDKIFCVNYTKNIQNRLCIWRLPQRRNYEFTYSCNIARHC